MSNERDIVVVRLRDMALRSAKGAAQRPKKQECVHETKMNEYSAARGMGGMGGIGVLVATLDSLARNTRQASSERRAKSESESESESERRMTD